MHRQINKLKKKDKKYFIQSKQLTDSSFQHIGIRDNHY